MRTLLAACALLAALPAHAGLASIPPPPTGEVYLADYVDLLPAPLEERLARLQDEALNRYNSPIVVVTVMRMADYGASDIESLARRWFDAWRIGTLGLQGGANQGMLVLVSLGDRKARIELGADWGRRFDAYAQRVMDEAMIPRFKRGDYAGGIEAAVQQLLEMAKAGPKSSPPGGFLGEKLHDARKYSLFPPGVFLMSLGAGFLLIVLSFFIPSQRKILVGAGVAIIVITLFTTFVLYAVVAIVGIFGKSRRRSGGFSSSSRGFSGGFSGGGGASGSW